MQEFLFIGGWGGGGWMVHSLNNTVPPLPLMKLHIRYMVHSLNNTVPPPPSP